MLPLWFLKKNTKIIITRILGCCFPVRPLNFPTAWFVIGGSCALSITLKITQVLDAVISPAEVSSFLVTHLTAPASDYRFIIPIWWINIVWMIWMYESLYGGLGIPNQTLTVVFTTWIKLDSWVGILGSAGQVAGWYVLCLLRIRMFANPFNDRTTHKCFLADKQLWRGRLWVWILSKPTVCMQ